MSILIRGMEMPKRCFECPCMGEMFGYFVCLITAKDMRAEHSINISRPDWCPLIELPPHGRLGDLDKLMTEFMDSDLDHLQRDDWREVIQIVADAPTVIEAEGREE